MDHYGRNAHYGLAISTFSEKEKHGFCHWGHYGCISPLRNGRNSHNFIQLTKETEYY